MTQFSNTASAGSAGLENTDAQNQLESFSRSQAVIEFEPDGTIITANQNFCDAVGYTLDEIRGKHHRMFCDPETTGSAEYAAFWSELASGSFSAGEFERVAKNGDTIWIQASYNPVLDQSGQVYKVVKIASDITEQTSRAMQDALESKKVNEMLRQLPLNVMLVDKDLVLTYMNDTSRATLKSIEHNLPVRADDMIGTCIDVFHKDPSVQRRILGDPKKYLPHKVEIQIGGEDVDLQADGVYDEKGEFIGYMATWTIITEQKKTVREAEQARERERQQTQDLQNKVNQLLEVATAAGQGDLTRTVNFPGDDAMAQLANGFTLMLENISATLRDVDAGTGQIDDGAQQISSASQSLSDGASTQASSLEEISSSLEELTSMTERNADNCRQAAGLAEEGQKAAKLGSDEMSKMSQAMDEIKSSSDEISKIIRVIDEIAFQTNLLALNAAVEAARAGEAGKGFAVVAEEVRNLAQRSAEAAKNTSSMIDESSKRAENGVAIAEGVGKSLTEIVESIDKVNALVAEIAAASTEQSDGIKQINKGVTELDSVTQRNAGNAEELASSAEETAAQVSSLRDLVGRFTIEGAQPKRQAPAQTPAPAPPAPTQIAPPPELDVEAEIPFDDDDLASF
ncbi:MAG: methyl-accepting chemotaxis protein [Planctomycetota bacterium]